MKHKCSQLCAVGSYEAFKEILIRMDLHFILLLGAESLELQTVVTTDICVCDSVFICEAHAWFRLGDGTLQVTAHDNWEFWDYLSPGSLRAQR